MLAKGFASQMRGGSPREPRFPKHKKVGLIEYTLILSISNIGNKILSYSIDLTKNEEDNPQDFFNNIP